MGGDRCFQPAIDTGHSRDIRGAGLQMLYLLDSCRQEVRVDDPDRSAEILDIGVGINAAFARSIWTGDDPEFRPIKLFARHGRASRISSCLPAAPWQHSAP